jgi:hypothetical protein
VERGVAVGERGAFGAVTAARAAPSGVDVRVGAVAAADNAGGDGDGEQAAAQVLGEVHGWSFASA